MHGHHVYKDVWTPTIGEKFEPNNIKGYSVCVQKDGVMVGHLMLGKALLRLFFTFYEDTLTQNQVMCLVSCVGKDKRFIKELVG